MDKKLSRKERRAEQFGHSSPSRILYDPKFEDVIDHSYMRDVEDAFREMRRDVREQKIEHFYDGRLRFLENNGVNLAYTPQYRDESFYLTH